ncbi:protein FAM53B isoform X2 [Phascolarctos cinereus]
MAMILTRPLENKGAADSITCKPLHPELHTPEKMSQGPTLFSCGMMENGGWRDLDRKCPLQLEQASSIWDCLPEKSRDTAAACSVTSLIRDLSLSDHHGNPAAPPSKRQCRSLSFSDEMSSCRTAWRPLGSKVWTPVEKRRCYSGGSVQRYSSGPCAMQRSSSFSLPSRADTLSSSSSSFSDRAGVHGRFGGQPCPGILGSAAYAQAGDLWCSDSGPAGGRSVNIQRSLSCSRERFSFSEYCPPSASSTPASTPELARRSCGLSRSRSQPCVLNEKKVGVKRRRPEDPQELRPSLDLAKMTQVAGTPAFPPAPADSQLERRKAWSVLWASPVTQQTYPTLDGAFGGDSRPSAQGYQGTLIQRPNPRVSELGRRREAPGHHGVAHPLHL